MKQFLLVILSLVFGITQVGLGSAEGGRNRSQEGMGRNALHQSLREKHGFKNFMAKPGIIGENHVSEYVDVYYAPTSFSNADFHDAETRLEGARGFWKESEALRNTLICQSSSYLAKVSLQHPSVSQFKVMKLDDLLSGEGIWLEVVDSKGDVYASYNSPVKARQNTFRAGLYYYDPHLYGFKLADNKGKVIRVRVEMILHCYPDKIHVEALFEPGQNVRIRRAELVCKLDQKGIIEESPFIFRLKNSSVGIVGGRMHNDEITAEAGEYQGHRYDLRAYLTFIPGKVSETRQIKERMEAELHPLTVSAFKLKNAVFGGYDPASGYYTIIGTSGIGIPSFSGFYRNPNMYLSAKIGISNDSLPREIYIRHECTAGPIESAVLTDTDGFPLPTPVQASKNFAGDENKDGIPDRAFSESCFPVKLAPNAHKTFCSLQLHQNWGDHPLVQLSSIRFYQIYYHLSVGVTETVCFTLPTKFDTAGVGQFRSYNLTDYRPMSGQMWHSSPQHTHVALQGWLQYLDKNGHWCYPRYTGSDLYSVGPNLAWLTMNYTSSDGKVGEKVEIMEMPQSDQTRTFLRIKYTFRHDVTVKGNIEKDFRLLNKGTYILKAHWKKIAWLNPQGKIQIRPLKYDGKWSAVGEPLRRVNSFFCAYPYIDGNDALILRRVGGTVNGKPFDKVGLSAIGHPGDKTELMLVPIMKGKTIKAGSTIEIDCILMPYGDDASSYFEPMQESVRFGLSHAELAATGWDTTKSKVEIMGPEVSVKHGELIRDLPPLVEAKNNWAQFDLTGGENRMSCVVAGFSSYKLPMLWDGLEFIDPQVRGGDGYEVFRDADGRYGFVFTPRSRTTRAHGEWGSKTHSYIVSEAVSSGNITSVNSLNGEVKLKISGKGATSVKSPRLWCPADNRKVRNEPIFTSTTDSPVVRTIPLQLLTNASSVNCRVDRFASSGFKMEITCKEAVSIDGQGLDPDSQYSVRIDREVSQMKTNDLGEFEFSVRPGSNMEVECSLTRDSSPQN